MECWNATTCRADLYMTRKGIEIRNPVSYVARTLQ